MKKPFPILFAFSLILMPVQALAYIDPGSGSAIVSLVIGFFVAIGVVLKTFWFKIQSILGLSKPPKADDDTTEDKTNEEN